MCDRMQELTPSRPLLDKSQNVLARTCLRQYRGRNASNPDIMLKLGDVLLPAHRFLLAGTSKYFKALFQASTFKFKEYTVGNSNFASVLLNELCLCQIFVVLHLALYMA